MKKRIIDILGILFLLLLVASCGSDEPLLPQEPGKEGPGKEEPKPGLEDDNDEVEGAIYNGIKLPDVWPPQRNIATELEKGMVVPYLVGKPTMINISVGRQLFVDDFLIEATTLERQLYYPEYYSGNPVLAPNKRWESVSNTGDGFAAPFSDGVWYDEADSKYKMWYEAGGGAYSQKNAGVTCYAESTDGITWDKPTTVGIVSGTNIVDYNSVRDASTIWIDKQETDPSKRYKMFLVARNADNDWEYTYKTSPDGLIWTKISHSKQIEDRSTVYKNPFRNVWSFSMRHNRRVNSAKLVRCRVYSENEDLMDGVRAVGVSTENFWFGPWPGEQVHPRYPDIEPAIYNHDAIPYESIMLGYFSVWQGPENAVAESNNEIKRNQIMIGYSRDGYYWSRENLNPFLPVNETEGAWNFANLQSVAGVPLIVGDKGSCVIVRG